MIGGPRDNQQFVKSVSSAVVILCLLAVTAYSAPAEVRAEASESVTRSGPPWASLPSLLAASPTTAALLYQDSDDRIRIRFVTDGNKALAVWHSNLRRAPRLVCTSCPGPLVADNAGFYAFSNNRWDTVSLRFPRSSLSDPMTVALGVIRSTGTARSVPLLLGGDGKYRAVQDGGPILATRPTGLRPELGNQVDFQGGPSAGFGTLRVASTDRDRFLSLQAPGLALNDNATIVLADVDRILAQTKRAAPGSVSPRSTPCVGQARDGEYAVLLVGGIRSYDDASSQSQRIPSARLVWLGSNTLRDQGHIELTGFYDHCTILHDGSVFLWTGVSAGAAAVDVALVAKTGATSTRIIPIADDTLVNVVLESTGATASISVWPLGKQAVRIDSDFEVSGRPGVGGSQILSDSAGGYWISYPAVNAVARVSI